MAQEPLLTARGLIKRYGRVTALNDCDFDLYPGEILAVIGDNGAGKSTLIKTLSGVHKPTGGSYLVDGRPVVFQTPRDALDAGIATVYQDLAMVPLTSIARNFFMGREPLRGIGPLKFMDLEFAERVAREEMRKIGIDVRDPGQAVGTLSGGERQCVAIARAVYFGAKVLILDEPTSALGVAQTSMVLKYVNLVRGRGLGVSVSTHTVHTHIKSIYRKLQAHSKAEAIRKGRIRGVL